MLKRYLMNAFENKKECKLVPGKSPFCEVRTPHSQSYGEKKIYPARSEKETCSIGKVVKAYSSTA